MRIAMFTLSYNTEKWIYPFLKLTQGLEKRIILQGKTPFDGEHFTDPPDRSEAFIRKHFPDVEIHYQHGKTYTDCINEGLELLSDYDFVLRFDSDELFFPKDWSDIVQLVRETNPLSLKYDMAKAIYYYDIERFDHGLYRDLPEWLETRGLRTTERFGDFGSYGGPGHIIRDKVMHHFSGWKGKGLAESTKTEEELLRVHGKDGRFMIAPTELQELFKEGWDLLEEL